MYCANRHFTFVCQNYIICAIEIILMTAALTLFSGCLIIHFISHKTYQKITQPRYTDAPCATVARRVTLHAKLESFQGWKRANKIQKNEFNSLKTFKILHHFALRRRLHVKTETTSSSLSISGTTYKHTAKIYWQFESKITTSHST